MNEEPNTFLDIFEIVVCLDDDNDNILCKLTGKKTLLYQARKIYVDKSNGKICKDGWIIDDDNDNELGENSGNATIFSSTCKDKDNANNYIAKFIKLDHSFGIKSVINEILIQNKVYSRFRNITIPIYQAFLANNNAYAILMMDFIKGLTVRRYIQQNIETKVVDIINIVAHCKKLVTFLFHKGFIIHGDTHLNNFMFIPGSTIKMIDFGGAKEIVPLSEKIFSQLETQPFLLRLFDQPIKDAVHLYQRDLRTIDNDLLVHIKNENIPYIIEKSNKIIESYTPQNEPPRLVL